MSASYHLLEKSFDSGYTGSQAAQLAVLDSSCPLEDHTADVKTQCPVFILTDRQVKRIYVGDTTNPRYDLRDAATVAIFSTR